MIYWDYNAGAPLLPQVGQKVIDVFREAPGNPSSVHQVGRRVRRHLDAAREQVAALLGASPREVSFTGSASEAAATAIVGAWRARQDASKKRIVTTAIEHPCVLGAVKQIEAEGAEVVRLAPDVSGQVSLEAVKAALTPATALCSIQWVNNETGVIQPVGEVSRWCVEKKIVFHTDAAQAFGKIPASLRECPADLLTLSAHKLGGPTGVGVLYGRRGVNVAALTPGHQENGRRGGTQSAALASGLAMALNHAIKHQESTETRLSKLRDDFEAQVLAQFPETLRNGTAARVGNTSNLCFPGVDGEALLIGLDLEGICVSTGAACASGTLSPSHVLLAMGRTSAQAAASLRFSLGHEATAEEVASVVSALTTLLNQQRRE